MNTTIWWIRRDLRVNDNPALQMARENGECVIPVFILDPKLLSRPAQNRQRFLFSGLNSLKQSLLSRQNDLVLREGDPLEVLTGLVNLTGASGIYAEKDVSPYAIRRDQKIMDHLPLQLVEGLTIYPINAVKKADGTPYTVFTPYKNAWKALPELSPSYGLSGKDLPIPRDISDGLDSVPLIEIKNPSDFRAGEGEANKRLDDFLREPIYQYASNRDRTDLEGTSGLSPFIHFGMISIQRLFQTVNEMAHFWYDPLKRNQIDTWINELIWREFYYSILYHFPEVTRTAFRPQYRSIRWIDNVRDLDAWKNGETGYPIVDAGMRQLRTTGWMHNRARMIVASFLVKDLAVNWQAGEAWFMELLVDGDLAANNGGWQWTAGVGTDASPYFRIFNPIVQGEKFDPQGDYVRQWVPELRKVPRDYIHKPWKMPLDVQENIGIRIGLDYPGPLVDHAKARERIMNLYRVG